MASSLREVTLDAFQAGAATAAKALGYAGLASIILSDHLGPEAIARLFRLSVSKHAAQDLVVILSAGSIARYKAHPNGWDGEVERKLAQEAIARQGNGLDFEKLSWRASALVKARWGEIAQLTDSP
jgi:hypothetical protein